MRKSILLTAVLSTLAMTNIAYAEEAPAEAAPAAAPAEPESNWTATSNIGFTSDYYFRGISQTWHKPAVQGGFDLAHSSGFYAGVWGSNITPNTFPDATVEIDLYAGYNGSISAVEGLGYTVGLYGYFYPGGSWEKYDGLTADQGRPSGGRWNTYEANFGLSYKWISGKVSVTLGDWFGAEKETGWDGGTSGTTYVELNAAYPLPWGGLTLIGHIGHLNVAGRLQSTGFPTANGAPGTYETNPDYTDYKVGISKSFSIAKSEGWNAGIYYVGADDTGYWDNGYGGTSFSRSINGSTETKNLADGRFIVTVGRTF